MADIERHDVCLRQHLAKAREVGFAEGAVARPPDEHRRQTGEAGPLLPERAVVGVRSRELAAEDPGGLAASARSKRTEVVPTHRRGELPAVGEARRQEPSRRGVEAQIEEAADRTRDEAREARHARIVVGPHPGVDEDDGADAFPVEREREADGAAEVVNHEDEIAQVQRFDEARQSRGVIGGTIGSTGGLVGETEAQVVDCDAAMLFPKSGDGVAPFERPRGRPVDEDNGAAPALVDVVQAVTVEFDEACGEGVERAIEPRALGERRGGRACKGVVGQCAHLRNETWARGEPSGMVRSDHAGPNGASRACEGALEVIGEHLTFDAALFHELSPRVPLERGAWIGIDVEALRASMARWDETAVALGRLRDLAMVQSGVASDTEAFPLGSRARRQWRARFGCPFALQNALAAHLVVHQRIVSVLLVARRRGPAFTPHERQVLTGMVPALSLADAFFQTLESEAVRGPAAALECVDQRLTPRQREVVVHVALGRSNAEIGRALGISENTVRNLLAQVRARLAVANRAEIVRVAVLR